LACPITVTTYSYKIIRRSKQPKDSERTSRETKKALAVLLDELVDVLDKPLHSGGDKLTLLGFNAFNSHVEL
jgi:hypothetical protein